jgi:two-component system response regulator AlgR
VRVLIADDEPLARQRLLRLVRRLRPDAEVFEASDGPQTLRLVAEIHPSLLLLDIRMPGMDGVEVAARLLTLDAPPAVIFCTAYDEYALAALRNHAIAYLMKPVRESELQDALNAAVRINQAQLDALAASARAQPYISSAGHRGVQRIALSEVRCFIAEDKYVRVVAPAGTILLSDSLKDLEARYPDEVLRVHRNALVARAHVRGVSRDADGWVVDLDGVGERPRVSRRHLAELKAVIVNA